MKLRSLTMRHYRNYTDQTVVFDEGVNIFSGENAQGKTNLIEALFFLSRGYSHRAVRKQEIITFDESEMYVSAEVTRGDVRHNIRYKTDQSGKELTLDQKKAKHSQVSRTFPVILFEPDDLHIIKAGPERRRRFIDEELSEAIPAYRKVLKQYRRALKQRNALLKAIRQDATLTVMLDGWDEQLVTLGSKLISYRLAYLKRLNTAAKKIHRILSGEREELSLMYQNNVIDRPAYQRDIEKAFAEKIAESRETDLEKGTSVTGPHLDDIVVMIGGREARRFGSQGQQRSAAIALKLSQIDIYEALTGELPIVLLDDILSELDESRQRNILKLIDRNQSVITCTNADFMRRHHPEGIAVFTVHNGVISQGGKGDQTEELPSGTEDEKEDSQDIN